MTKISIKQIKLSVTTPSFKTDFWTNRWAKLTKICIAPSAMNWYKRPGRFQLPGPSWEISQSLEGTVFEFVISWMNLSPRRKRSEGRADPLFLPEGRSYWRGSENPVQFTESGEEPGMRITGESASAQRQRECGGSSGSRVGWAATLHLLTCSFECKFVFLVCMFLNRSGKTSLCHGPAIKIIFGYMYVDWMPVNVIKKKVHRLLWLDLS